MAGFFYSRYYPPHCSGSWVVQDPEETVWRIFSVARLSVEIEPNIFAGRIGWRRCKDRKSLAYYYYGNKKGLRK